MRYLLDTTFAVDFLRGDDAALRRFDRLFEDGDEPYVNDVVLCELAVGIKTAEDAAFDGFVHAVSFVQPGPETAVRAGRWRAAARDRGLALSLADALIAAAADSLDAVVLTRNLRHFGLTPVPYEGY